MVKAETEVTNLDDSFVSNRLLQNINKLPFFNVCIHNVHIDGYLPGSLSGTKGTPPREIAIKIPLVDANAGKDFSLKDFYLEAQITMAFDHENILSCLGMAAGNNLSSECLQRGAVVLRRILFERLYLRNDASKWNKE